MFILNSEYLSKLINLMGVIKPNIIFQRVTDRELASLKAQASLVGLETIEKEGALAMFSKLDGAKDIVINATQIAVTHRAYSPFPETWTFGKIIFKNNFKFFDKSLERLFTGCKADLIDLSGLDLSEVTNAYRMFADSDIGELIFGESKDFKSCRTMHEMFKGSQIGTCDFENVRTRDIETMQAMFADSKLDTLDLSNLDLSNVENINAMFKCANIKRLKMGESDNKIISADECFLGAHIEDLNISKFKFDKLETAVHLFREAHTNEIDLSNRKFKSGCKFTKAFENLNCRLVDISNTEFSNCVELNSMFEGAQAMELNMVDTQADGLDEAKLLGRSHIWIVRKTRDERGDTNTCETET